MFCGQKYIWTNVITIILPNNEYIRVLYAEYFASTPSVWEYKANELFNFATSSVSVHRAHKILHPNQGSI
jgi:hypothetical protein